MSMISSLDALDAATDATPVPRAQLFQPKVKPRARKGGGIGDPRSSPAIPATPAAPRESSEAAADPAPITVATEVTASETSAKASEAQNSSSTTAECDVDRRSRTDEKCLATEGGAQALEHEPVRNDAPETSAAQPDDLSSEAPVVVEPPPVAVRSNFPLLPTPPLTESVRSLSGSGETSNKPAKSGDETRFSLQDVQNPNSLNPAVSEEEGGAGSSRQEQHETQEDLPVEEETGLDAEQQAVSEALSTRKRRKRAFCHSTSHSRTERRDDEPAPPLAPRIVDFSKTDLSNPAKLTMREIIRRAEAIERKKMKEGGGATKKSSASASQNAGKQKKQDAAVSTMVPRVHLVNGMIVINEQSMTVGAFETSRQNLDEYTRVEENASRLNYHSYSNRVHTERWKTDDTDVFYRALRQFGTDFELITNLFPGRNRRQVKAKFKKEERNNPTRLQDALAHRPTDQLHYTDMITRLKNDDADQNADDHFANILADTNDAATAAADDEADVS